MAKNETIGWEFTYRLSNKINCDKNIHDMKDVEFVTCSDHKRQKTITGFKIMTCELERFDAEMKADQMAAHLTSLLVASSGMHSMHSMNGWVEIKMSGKHMVGGALTVEFQIHNNAIVNIDLAKFHDILNGNSELTEKIHFIADAWQSSRARDPVSVIKHLILACKEGPELEWKKDQFITCKDSEYQVKKFKYLRNALSHNKDELKQSTKEALEKFYPAYFKLTDDGKFDFSSMSNLRNLEVQAMEFIRWMHADLKKELCQRGKRLC